MKKAVACLVSFFAVALLFSLEVNRKELQDETGNAVIEFVNYVGPHTVVNTADEIRGIGTQLGRDIQGAETAGSADRYQIIHAVDPAVTGKFDADILVIGSGATVDHIDNIRRVLAAYLSSAYGYSDRDANTLAFFVTVYNAVYRGNMDMFTTRYKDVVTTHLSKDTAGIATRWDQWPGKTRMVIPLSDARLAGTVSTIDTSAISDSDVTEKIREEDDAALDVRKDMVDLKERESDEAAERAESAQKEAAKAKTETAEKRAEAADARREAERAEKEAEKARAEAEKNPEDSAAQREAAVAEQEAIEKAAEAERKETEVAETEQQAAEKEEEAAVEQTFADTKQQEAQQERKEIASDTQKVIDREAEEAKAAAEEAFAAVVPGYALRVIDKTTLLSELVLVNLATGSTIKTSPLNSIRNRIIVDAGGQLMAVAGKKGGSGDVTLVLIDPATLEMTKSGTDSLSEESMLVKSGNDYYAVIEKDSGKYAIGRFDGTLELKASSAIAVLAETAITVTPRGILVQDDNAKIRLLRATDLADQTED